MAINRIQTFFVDFIVSNTNTHKSPGSLTRNIKCLDKQHKKTLPLCVKISEREMRKKSPDSNRNRYVRSQINNFAEFKAMK